MYLVHVYNALLGVPAAHPSADTVLRPLVDQVLADPDLAVAFFIADKPARHFIRGLVSHSGKYSCETCIAGAKTGPVHWPYHSSWGATERTVEMMLEAVRLVCHTCICIAFRDISKVFQALG